MLLYVLSIGAAILCCLIGSREVSRTVFAGIVGFILATISTLWIFPTIGFFYVGPWIIVILAGVIGGIIGGVKEYGEFNVKGLYAPISAVAILGALGFLTTCSAIRSTSYRDLIGKVEERDFASDVNIADTKHIRLVSFETACAMADKVLGQSHGSDILGSQLELDKKSAAVQEVNGELWWVFPLDFRDFFKWNQRGSIPGYVRVSAQDPNLEAQLVTKDVDGKPFDIKFTPGAYFDHYLDRKLYHQFPYSAREDRTFEIDEKWRPFYTYSLTEPMIGFSGYTTKGVVIADPQTGEFVLRHAGDIPSWVDRVRPVEQALDQVNWWGEYTNGWLNAIFSHRGVKVATKYQTGDMWFVELAGKKYWYTGMTSSNNKEGSMVGLVFVDSQACSGGAVYYRMQGSDETGVHAAIQSALGAYSTTWTATQPIPYNIHGVPTFVVPIVSNTGYFQKVALVDMANLNRYAIEDNLEKALSKYRQVMAVDGNDLAPTNLAALRKLGPVKVLRVGDTVLGGEKMYYLLLEGNESKLFSTNGSSSATRQAVLVEKGDMVTVGFTDTGEDIVPITILEVAGMHFEKSKEQTGFDKMREDTKKDLAKVSEPRDADARWNNLTPEQKKGLLENVTH